MRNVVIPIFIPHKGCKFDCIYCNQKSISGQINDVTYDEAKSIIDSYVKTLRSDDYTEIGFYGGSFTGIENDKQIQFLQLAKSYIDKGLVNSIRLSTRPDYINNEILDYLFYYGVKTIELGVQSMDDKVLEKNFRGHTSKDVINAVNLIKARNINLGIQTMIGLLGSTIDKEIYTAQKVVSLQPDVVRIYPTIVIKSTFLEKMYIENKYNPLSLEEAIEISAKVLKIYDNNNIKVIRIGLQATDNIAEGKDIVAGPFHPAFGQLVRSRVMLKQIEDDILNNGLNNKKELTIYTNKQYISDVIGQKRSNISYLKDKYGFNKVIVREIN